jgi:hypothetical protein
VPTHVVIPKGTAVLFLNADAPWDTPHPHTINVKDSSGNVIYTTGKMNYSDASELKKITSRKLQYCRYYI